MPFTKTKCQAKYQRATCISPSVQSCGPCSSPIAANPSHLVADSSLLAECLRALVAGAPGLGAESEPSVGVQDRVAVVEEDCGPDVGVGPRVALDEGAVAVKHAPRVPEEGEVPRER